MSRSERLLALLQSLRQHRVPVSGRVLADELGVSLRTLYRDVASLQAQGAKIEGEAGVGYVLKPGFMLPPLMFSDEEIEALVLGSRWVAKRADPHLAQSARSALAKIVAVLPPDLRLSVETNALFVAPRQSMAVDRVDASLIRRAIRQGHKLRIDYADVDGRESARVIWPIAIGFFDEVRVVVAWCELRGDFRHFRTDRMNALQGLPERYPRSKHVLLREWTRLQRLAETHAPKAVTADGN